MKRKKLILGTAMWGWSVSQSQAFEILDKFVQEGGFYVDTAINYPINRRFQDCGLVLKWLSEWQKKNDNSKISLIVKIGAKNNFGGDDFDLTERNILDTTKRLQGLFGSALSCISVHWDNRGEESINDIYKTVAAMSKVHEKNLDIGMSGVKNPEYYYTANKDLAGKWLIQVKENVSTKSSRLSYSEFFPDAQYYAYGINMGGGKIGEYSVDSSIKLRNIKIDSEIIEKVKRIINDKSIFSFGVDSVPKSFNDFSLAYSFFNEYLSGVIIGPRDLTQLEDTLCYWKVLESNSFDIELVKLLNNFHKN